MVQQGTTLTQNFDDIKLGYKEVIEPKTSEIGAHHMYFQFMKNVSHDEKESSRVLEKIALMDKTNLSQSRIGNPQDD